MATRIAMVWANGQEYVPMPGKAFPSVLPKAKKDGEAMATFLTENGFEILSGKAMCEQNLVQMMDGAEKFVDAVRKRKPEVALLYYSGHGLEDSEKNLFMGVDYQTPKSARMNEKICFSPQEEIVDELKGSETVLIFIFDCCRQPKSESVLKGELSTQTAQTGINTNGKGMVFTDMNTIALFGAGAGQLASDGADMTECSALTQAILDTAKNTATEEALSFFGRVNETAKGIGAQTEMITQGKNLKFAFLPCPSTELAKAPADSFKIKGVSAVRLDVPMKAESLEVDTEADEDEQEIGHMDVLWDVAEQGGVPRADITRLKTLRWNFRITTELGDTLRTIMIKRIGIAPSDITDKFFALVVTSYATGARKQFGEGGDGPGSVWNFLVCLAMDLGGKGMAMTGMHFKQGTFFQGYIKCVDKTIAKSMGKKVATHMVVLLSNAFFQSPMCMVEVHHAIQSNIKLVLVNIEELDWPIEDKAWPLKASQTRYPFSDGTVNWGDAEFAGNRAAVLRAVTGDNSYPRPGSVVTTWGRDGGIRVFMWMVAEVGGELHPKSEAGGTAMIPSTLAALHEYPPVVSGPQV
jgi:hypothetical protein